MPSIRTGNRRRLAMIERSNRRMVPFDIESCGFDYVDGGFRTSPGNSYKPIGGMLYTSTGESRPARDLLYEDDGRSKFVDMSGKKDKPNGRTFAGRFEVAEDGSIILPNSAYDIMVVEKAFSLFSKPDEGISAEHAERLGAMPDFDEFVAGLPDGLPDDQPKG